MGTEIERRFLVTELPRHVATSPGQRIRQGYLAEEADVGVRIRRAAGDTLTVKAGTGVSRTEVELSLDEPDAEALWSHTVGRRLEKVRHRVDLDGHVAEVDVYEGTLAGVVVVEVEFADLPSAMAFQPPHWFDAEVTDDARWSNAALARDGRPR